MILIYIYIYIYVVVVVVATHRGGCAWPQAASLLPSQGSNESLRLEFTLATSPGKGERKSAKKSWRYPGPKANAQTRTTSQVKVEPEREKGKGNKTHVIHTMNAAHVLQAGRRYIIGEDLTPAPCHCHVIHTIDAAQVLQAERTKEKALHLCPAIAKWSMPLMQPKYSKQDAGRRMPYTCALPLPRKAYRGHGTSTPSRP